MRVTESSRIGMLEVNEQVLVMSKLSLSSVQRCCHASDFEYGKWCQWSNSSMKSRMDSAIENVSAIETFPCKTNDHGDMIMINQDPNEFR